MNAITALYQWTLKNRFITTGIAGVVLYGAYKLVDKAIDTAERLANRAMDEKYSFAFPSFQIKANVQNNESH